MSDRQGRIPLGPKPADTRDAWRVLTPEAKQALQELRNSGRHDMGGTPQQAPYWLSQEQGNDLAHIEARRFVQRAIADLRAALPYILDDWLRS